MKIVKMGESQQKVKTWTLTTQCENCQAVLEVSHSDLFKHIVEVGGSAVGELYKYVCPCCGSKSTVAASEVPCSDDVQSKPEWARARMLALVAALYQLDPKTWPQRRLELDQTEEFEAACNQLGI